jgi:hypothetical protein
VPDRKPEKCDLHLYADHDASLQRVGQWWLRVQRAARNAGVFEYGDTKWVWGAATLSSSVNDKMRRLGWRCPQDGTVSGAGVIDRMWAREPWQAHGILSMTQAEARRCRLAFYSTR